MIEENRLKHMIGVAQYMYDNADRYNLDAEEMYVLGLLHDIGYISGSKEGHEQYGADIIKRCFSTNFGMPYFGEIIAIHDVTPQDYLLEHDTILPELLLLLEADMMVDLTGECVGFEKRLSDIEARHGLNSKPYKVCNATMNWLRENVI